ncbi:DNAse I-like superfamily protein, partial [Prunus dulcis]
CTLSNHLDQPTLESDFSQLRPPFQAIPVPNEPPHFPLSALPSSASIRHCSSRKLPRNRPGPTVFPKICGSSFSFVSQPNRSSKAVEVRGIHHRANYSFRAKGF